MKETQVALTTKSLFAAKSVQERFEKLLGKKAQGFVTSALQVVNGNQALVKADPVTVLNAVATAAAMDLPINNNLGYAYVVPYGGQAQFQMGYKGFIQLAQRTGQYKTINATDVRQGEIKSHDRMTGEIVFDWNQTDERLKLPIIGYMAYFELLNGFSKSMYMTDAELNAHGSRYSQTYAHKSGRWTVDRRAMCLKTVLKLLISKYGPLSIEMQLGVEADQAIQSEEGKFEYIDNEPPTLEENNKSVETERIRSFIEKAKTVEDLEAIFPNVTDETYADYMAKMEGLKG